MCIGLRVRYLLFLFDFYEIGNVLMNFSKSPKYEMSRKVLLVVVALCRSDIWTVRHDNDGSRFSQLLYERARNVRQGWLPVSRSEFGLENS